MIFGSKSPKVDVTEYSLSVHFGICLGPVDALTGIKIGEKNVWAGMLTGLSQISVYLPQLFGGDKKEGGPIGQVIYLPGSEDQVLPEELARRLGLTSATAPGYRGVGSIFFIGGSNRVTTAVENSGLPPSLRRIFAGGSGSSNTKGFIWGNNNPNLPTTEVEVRRSPKGLNPAQSMIGNDANPAHAIYECMTNTDWGMGESPALFDVESFNAAAETLINEQFGISMIFTQQAEVQSFVNQIIEHIQATLYINPRTGLWTIKLLRADYDVDELPSFDESNSAVQSYQRRGYGEIANEIIVSWTNPVSEEEETVSVQDLAGIVAQGGRIVTDNRDYTFVRNIALAGRLAVRDLRASTTPLASAEATLDREGWDIVPGAVIKLTSEEHGFTNVVFRVLTVDYGTIDSASIRVSLVEDIFGLSYDNYFQPTSSQWTSPSQLPEDMTHVLPFTIPAFLQPYMAEEVPTSPDAILGVFASSEEQDTFEYDFAVQTQTPDGQTIYDIAATRSTVSRGALLDPLVSEPISSLTLPPMTTGEGFFPGSFVLFQGEDESRHEIAVVGEPNEDGTVYQLQRGAMDTVPRDWPAGTPIWLFSFGTVFDDDIFRAEDSEVNFKLLTRTSLGTLEETAATEYVYSITDRPYRPLRPANVKINGEGFGEIDAREAPSISATWSNRNRLTETDVLQAWTLPGVTPEAGQTTSIEIRGIDGTLVNTIDNISGESYTFNDYDFVGLGLARVSFFSKRDGLVSLQGHELLVRRLSGGWGFSWGFAWGGNS
jgi:hypothetical protein